MEPAQTIPNARKIPLPRLLRLFLILSAALTALCAVSELLCHYFFHLTASVYIQPVFVGQSFLDFMCYHDNFPYLHTALFFSPKFSWPFSYPAAMVPLYAIFMAFRPHELEVYLGVVLFLTILLLGLLDRQFQRMHLSSPTAKALAGGLLLLGYPFWFVFERANLEFLIFLLLAAGVIAFVKEKPLWAALCFGLAGSMKLFPIIYLGLLLSRRQYRALALGIATAALSTLLSLWFIGPTIPVAWRGIQNGITIFHDAFLLQPRPAEFGYDHSLYGFYRRFFPLPDPVTLAHALSLYMFTAAILGTALYFLRIRRLPVINQVLALAIAAILLPPASFDYTLIHLYVPLVMIFLLALDLRRQGRSAWRIPGLQAIVAVLALLTSPQSELIWHGYRIASQFKCLLLVLLFVLALRYPIQPIERRRRRDRTESQPGPQLVVLSQRLGT